MSIEHLEVTADKLTCDCDPDQFGFETTDDITPLEGTLGQERAISALEMALDIDAPGYNLYISGVAGSGRNSSLRAYLDSLAATKPAPPDWGYVYNFNEPSQPIALSLPCGMMRVLAADMNELVDTCRKEIPAAFESDDYNHRVEELAQDVQELRQRLTSGLEQEAQQVGFTLSFTQVGVTPVPIIDGRQMTQEEYANLSDEVKEDLREKAEGLQRSVTHMMREIRQLNKETTERINQVDTELVQFTLKPIVDELQEKYAEHIRIVEYLDHVEADMVKNLDMFKPREQPPMPIPGFSGGPNEEEMFVRYRVNDLIDNTHCDGAPIVFEHSPTYYNLFGHIEYRARVGTYTTDLTMIKPGAIHRANGGYLVIQARDLFLSPYSWETLKRTLRSGQAQIENIAEQFSALPSSTLRPEPIPINTKIILVGNPQLIYMLRAADEDVRRYFKVTADFDTVINRTSENLAKYAQFVAGQCKKSDLKPFHKTALAEIIDYSSRLVEDQDKLTSRLMDVSDMLTEANYWADKENSDVVRDAHVKKAVEQRRYRLSLTSDKIQELIEEGTIHIATEGERVGQVNGLAVYSMGEFSFGKPSRITARVSLGRGQLVNIERETQMSGRIHSKGFMILTGYLHGKYGQNKPLSLSASIGFEQTYSEVDGDSASSTELYSLLSELSGLPLNQSMAVTGSVNQAGDVQAIGGATHKIEGFFDICQAKGLTGNQGVMIPKDNVKNVLLRDDVVQAIEQGQFHIYAVSSIDEGIEVLTGVPAGERDDEGNYPEGTVHYLVEQRLDEMAQQAREFGRQADSTVEANNTKPEPVEEEPSEPEMRW